MERSEENGYASFKLRQARDAREEAQGLLEDDAELRYVANSLFYAYYYSTLALLHRAGATAAMQSVSIALLEKLLRGKGVIDDRFFPLIRKAFDLKPKCGEPGSLFLDRPTLQEMLREADTFILAAEKALNRLEAVVEIGGKPDGPR